MSFYDFKKTQGQAKMTQRLKELFSNESFIAKLEKIKSITNRKKQYNQIFNIAREYGLEYSPGSPLFSFMVGDRLDRKTTFENMAEDTCRVYDEVDEFLNSVFPYEYNMPVSKRPEKKLELYAYPIHIGISTKASKRDVLDYINKRWEYIRDLLNGYEDNPKGIRRRRKQKRDDFIWANRDLPAKDLADKVNEQFPDAMLTYSDINSILYYLRRRKYQL